MDRSNTTVQGVDLSSFLIALCVCVHIFWAFHFAPKGQQDIAKKKYI